MTGGWMDAGDMIHFGQTTGFSTALLEAAARLDPGNRAAIQQEADVGVRWLLKAHPFPDLFVTQVAGAVDHDRGFRDPASDDVSSAAAIGTRQAFHWGTGVGGDIGGKVATALALSADRAAEPGRACSSRCREWYAAGKAAGRATPERRRDRRLLQGRHLRGLARRRCRCAVPGHRRTPPICRMRSATCVPRTRRCSTTATSRRSPPPTSADGLARRRWARPRPARRRAGSSTRSHAKPPATPRERLRACELLHLGTTAISSAAGALAAMSGGSSRAVGAGRATTARPQSLGRELRHWLRTQRSPPRAPLGVGVRHATRPGAIVGGPAPVKEIRAQDLKPGGPLRIFNGTIAYEDARADYVTSEPTIDGTATAILLFAAL